MVNDVPLYCDITRFGVVSEGQSASFSIFNETDLTKKIGYHSIKVLKPETIDQTVCYRVELDFKLNSIEGKMSFFVPVDNPSLDAANLKEIRYHTNLGTFEIDQKSNSRGETYKELGTDSLDINQITVQATKTLVTYTQGGPDAVLWVKPKCNFYGVLKALVTRGQERYYYVADQIN